MKKVSILIPCYNAEDTISRLLDSILNQNYNNLEIIAVNDGSKDNTLEVLKEYKVIFEKHGCVFLIIDKENGGAASAIYFGIQRVTGDYLIWPDADDYLLQDSIKSRVDYLNSNPNCGIVRGNGYIYNSNDLSKPISVVDRKKRNFTTVYDFAGFNIPWCPGCYMIRMSFFDEVNPSRFIFISQCGQNIQMLLPITSKYPCHYIDKFVYAYLIYNNSHSHKKKSYEESMERIDQLKNCVYESLKIVHLEDSDVFNMHLKFYRNILYINAWENNNKMDIKKYSKILKENREFHFSHLVMKFFKPNKFIKYFINFLKKVEKRIYE